MSRCSSSARLAPHAGRDSKPPPRPGRRCSPSFLLRLLLLPTPQGSLCRCSKPATQTRVHPAGYDATNQPGSSGGSSAAAPPPTGDTRPAQAARPNPAPRALRATLYGSSAFAHFFFAPLTFEEPPREPGCKRPRLRFFTEHHDDTSHLGNWSHTWESSFLKFGIQTGPAGPIYFYTCIFTYVRVPNSGHEAGQCCLLKCITIRGQKR